MHDVLIPTLISPERSFYYDRRKNEQPAVRIYKSSPTGVTIQIRREKDCITAIIDLDGFIKFRDAATAIIDQE